MSDMGTFRIAVEVENMFRPGERHRIPGALVDTGADLSWFPAELLDSMGVERHERRRFRTAAGASVVRWVGPVFIHMMGKRATDDVVFAEPGDEILLGARSLEGLNLLVDPSSKTLIDAGPFSAALAEQHRLTSRRAQHRGVAHVPRVRCVTATLNVLAYPERPAMATRQ